jgi:hypothetical protein
MAVSSACSWSPTVDEIVRQGAQLAGLVPLGRSLDTSQAGHARDFLQASLKSLSAIGVGLCQWENTTLALTAGTVGVVTTTTLAADTLELDFPMMIAASGETSQTQVRRYVWEEYQQLSEKTQQGRPIACYVEATHTVSLKWWPVPDQAYTVSYRREKLARDADSGTTVDLRPRWTDALVYTMAHKMALAGSLGAERCRMLKELADEKIELAKGREHEGGDISFVVEFC